MYVAQCLEVDVVSQGRSIEESLDNLREALELYLEESAPPVEEQSDVIVATIEVVGQLKDRPCPGSRVARR